MQIVKRTAKNQVVIPKVILQQAGIDSDDTYLKVDYDPKLGAIVLRPVAIEEKIPVASMDRFEERVVKGQPGDQECPTMDAAITHLRRRRRTRR